MNSKLTLPLALALAGLSLHQIQADSFDGDTGETQRPGKATSVAGQLSPASKRIQSGIRLTELGRMRVYLGLNQEAVAYEDQIHELLSDADFRLFPAQNFATGDRLDPEKLVQDASKRKADLVYYIKLKLEEEPAFLDLKLSSATVTSQLYNVVSGELVATTTVTKKGERTSQDAKASETAGTVGIKAAVESIMAKTLEKEGRALIHEAQFTAIASETEAARILVAAQKLEGVSYARQMWFDVATGSLGIELIGSPKTVNDWKKWLENLNLKEEAQEEVKVVPNKGLREKYPDWFKG